MTTPGFTVPSTTESVMREAQSHIDRGRPSSRPTSRSQLIPSLVTNQSQDENGVKYDGSKTADVDVRALTPAEVENGTEGANTGDEGHRPAVTGWFGRNGRLGWLYNRNFYIVLILGQLLALGTTGTNTFTSLISNHDTSFPAFQSFLNYVLLNLVYTPFTIYRYGFKGWCRLIWKDGWKYLIFAFCDVEGNYFVVLSYNYTTMLSAQLINFWAIAMVVGVSFLFLRVRYHWFQIIGILICIGGMGVLFGSDHITGSDSSGHISGRTQVKGDLFALLGATFYGLANVTEEFLVSVRPMYEVLGQLGMYAMVINGVQAAIFDRAAMHDAHWNSQVGGYLAGYTLCLFYFYSTVPIMFRLSSAAFFNISLLTANFWGVVIGVKVFHYSIHWMYPIAFVCIIVGQVVYFIGRQIFGDESFKPWLGQGQERGVIGVGTAKRRQGHDTNELGLENSLEANDGQQDQQVELHPHHA